MEIWMEYFKQTSEIQSGVTHSRVWDVFLQQKKEWKMDREEMKPIHVGCLPFSTKWLQEIEKLRLITTVPRGLFS